MRDVVIIGGGLAGLVNSIQLASAGLNVLLIEKRNYPFHRVCGEYISNEALPYLRSIGADPESLNPAKIKRLLITSPSGIRLDSALEMGGFGVSRYTLDHFLYKLAKSKGVEFKLETHVTDAKFSDGRFRIFLSEGHLIESKLVIGSFGKRSNLDRQLDRNFFYKRSPYVGVKYHIKAELPKDLISLHNFKGGYCGISRIEEDKYCMCYMTIRDHLKKFGNIHEMEREVLWKNPFLKKTFQNSIFLYDKPEVINEISFRKKTAVENHILMAGDAAGMITPLCGNGMAMAIHSAKVLSSIIIKHYKKDNSNLPAIEKEYTKQWNKAFANRLQTGRLIQSLFINETLSDLSLNVLKKSSGLTKWLVGQTHGKEF
jgi:flavin-dependent dehydrogenase